jgi:hypothetical protein
MFNYHRIDELTDDLNSAIEKANRYDRYLDEKNAGIRNFLTAALNHPTLKLPRPENLFFDGVLHHLNWITDELNKQTAEAKKKEEIAKVVREILAEHDADKKRK